MGFLRWAESALGESAMSTTLTASAFTWAKKSLATFTLIHRLT
ncbi:hypothetical protein PAMC26577_11840 [Caballeronia sordidicola]|uniref:Uncharacterized protein n=1 Tax=Caballeronia sordidicola TaxID=196367 RepID=A0A242MXJ2_CABSO|nr:hypothetical protein PAMC26577_11840 [Caballeronia sordidicola]